MTLNEFRTGDQSAQNGSSGVAFTRSFFGDIPRSGAGVIEDKAHDDRVPQLAGRSTVVTTQATFFNEPEALVEATSLLVVRPDLKRDLVCLVRPRPVGRRAEERQANATSSVVLSHCHSEIGSSAAQVRVCLTDESPVVFRDESNGVGVVKVGAPSFDAGGAIERRLSTKPLVLTDHGIDKVEQPVEVIDGRRSHEPRLDGHERMMHESAWRPQ
jgi:hypothetical protein